MKTGDSTVQHRDARLRAETNAGTAFMLLKPTTGDHIMKRRCCEAACVAALFLAGTSSYAQERFVVLTQSATADVSGLRIVTVRDNMLSACYTVFILELPAPPGSLVPAAPDEATSRALARVRDAAEWRDQQLADLNAKTQIPGPVDPLNSYDAATKRAMYETERGKIEAKYEQALRSEIPGSSPWATALPGIKSGAFEDPAAANRRAIVDPDPTSAMKTMAAQFRRLDEMLRMLLERPQLAVSGPAACPAAHK